MAFILQQESRGKARQTNLFCLCSSTYNTKSIFYKESTAHAIPPVQLWKSNAITGLLPMSTFCTWTPRQNRHCLLTLTIVQLWEWQRRHLTEQTAPGQTNHLTKKRCRQYTAAGNAQLWLACTGLYTIKS